jgi:glycosyltransferase involved in cell wall biosynthesis
LSIYVSIVRQPVGTDRMKAISDEIHLGAMTYLREQYLRIAIFMVLVAILLSFQYDLKMSVSFIFGAVSSAMAGFVGMKAATKANVRTTAAAMLTPGFRENFSTSRARFAALQHDVQAMKSFTRVSAPVITSNVSSLPEVVGDAALLIDPMNASAIADAIVNVMSDGTLRAELVRRGLERVKSFSWARSVQRTQEVYAEVLG